MKQSTKYKSYDEVCLKGVEQVIDIFTGKWSFLIIEQLHLDKMCFSQIHKSLNISTKSLTDTLRHLEENDINKREAIPTNVPITVEYSLTPKGLAFDGVLIAMKKWGNDYL